MTKFAKKHKISDSELPEAVRRADNGLTDADLGGGVIKQRIARQGQGRRGGYRSII
ncbi:TPA: type II toxin-antitoxin system RelE/ParE family toxin, partial [Neisseria polysaccharea]